MEPITSWSEDRVSEWLRGLDAPVHQYDMSDWHLSGMDLLQVTSQDLEKLGVHKIGHQELILEAVEKLCSLTYGMGGENLRSLTEKLRAVAYTFQMAIQSHWRFNGYDGRSTTKLSAGTLKSVVDLITSAKGLFSLLNRYQFTQLSGYTSSKDIFRHCKELAEIVHKVTTVYEKEKDIISICRQLVAVCDDILKSSSDSVLSHTAQLESVDLVPVLPGDQLGIEITSTSSSNHYVTGTAAEPSNDVFLKVLAGDEVIQVNDQIVVGWSRANLVKKLRENSNGVTLILKKIPGSLRRKDSDQLQIRSTKKEEEKSQRSEEVEEGAEEEEEEAKEGEEENPRHSIFERVAASVRSLSFRRAILGPEVQQQPQPMGQEESELSPEREATGSLTSYQSQQETLSPPSASVGEIFSLEGARLSPKSKGDRSPSRRSPSPRLDQLERTSVSSCPEMGGHTANKETRKSNIKGSTTALSRRRISCRELGQPDCDGWLWKKRKESSVFIPQKWQRFWFVLKGPCLYWYTSQQDDKAEGLVNIASYNIESAGEHKRKYVFQMCHKKFQNFIFAADNVNDMGRWLNALIAAIQKHKKFCKDPDSEEECYSETESESESSPSPRRRNKKVQSNTLPRLKGKPNKVPVTGQPAEGGKVTGGPVDEMGMMLNNIKEGGVSLIGHEQPFTHDHFRRSFIRRNKNPIINEKAHTLRALQSTLKAKEAELQQINKLLDDSQLTVSKYRHWKANNEELLQEIERLTALKASQTKDGAVMQDVPTQEVALETVAGETTGAYRLSLSEGEQLVDAETAHVPEVSPSTETSSVLELSLGSLQDSINEELSQMIESGEASDYFYI